MVVNLSRVPATHSALACWAIEQNILKLLGKSPPPEMPEMRKQIPAIIR
jgi:hypothetical protein